jgi:putative alpha-1,2-mannosidase
MATIVASADPVDSVNMYIGTEGDSVTEYGGTMPFVEPPFAMTSWTPQTQESKSSQTSYRYKSKNIIGFIGTHQSAIWMGDFGYVSLMPEVDKIKMTTDQRKMAFKHADETATPYYYSVAMDAGSSRTLKAEITATDHCAIMQFTYPQNDKASLVVEATRQGIEGLAEVNSAKREITGYNPDRQDAHLSSLRLPDFKGYFVVQINKPFSSWGTYQKSMLEA